MTTTTSVMDAMAARVDAAPTALRSLWLEQLAAVAAEYADAPVQGSTRDRVSALLSAMAKPVRTREPVWADGDFMTFSTCNAADLRHKRYGELVTAFEVGPSGWIFHRSNWERAAVAYHLQQGGVLLDGRRGAGFGATDGALSNFFRKAGVAVRNFDAVPAAGQALEEAAGAFADNRHHFLWSLGMLNGDDRAAGTAFIARSTRDWLRPGGLAVHVFDFALDGEAAAPDAEALAGLLVDLREDGHGVAPFLVAQCNHVLDLHEDTAPYGSNPHLRLQTGNGLVTSAVLVVRRR